MLALRGNEQRVIFQLLKTLSPVKTIWHQFLVRQGDGADLVGSVKAAFAQKLGGKNGAALHLSS